MGPSQPPSPYAVGGAALVMLSAAWQSWYRWGRSAFLTVLTNPEQLWQQPWVQPLVRQVGFTQAQQLVLPATVTFALAAGIAAVIRLMNLWLNGRLAAAVGSDLSCEAYWRTLYQPYQVHVRRNSSTVISAMTQNFAQLFCRMRFWSSHQHV